MAYELHEALADARRRTLALVAHLEAGELEQVFMPILSPLAWDLGHIAAYEDLWLNHRLAGRPLMLPGMAELYDAFETPRASRGDASFLRGDELWEYLHDVRERALEAPVEDSELHEMVLRHELQHTETMLQALAAGGRLPDGWGRPEPLAGAGGDRDFRLVEAGEISIGAPAEVFSYDNERPRHTVNVDAFRIARRPVTNASWEAFVEDGGYRRRELWSDEGWAWREEHELLDHPLARESHPDAAVVHVSWFEAAAFAQAHDARLPTEAEWETAAAGGQLEGVGSVWEWTCSSFAGYPGFRAHPYREYSEVFFGDAYRTLRGWSCVTAERVASIHFRNWDLPQRRQLFAGLRLVRKGSP